MKKFKKPSGPKQKSFSRDARPGNPRTATSRSSGPGRTVGRPAGPRSPVSSGTGGRSSTPALPKGRPVVGIHAVRELFKVRPHAVVAVLLKEGFDTHADLREIAERAERARLRPTVQSAANLDKIAGLHQGVIAFASEAPELSFGDVARRETATLVVLDEVEDPHNLGAVMRTAWLFGAQGVLTPEARAAPVTATVSKVAQGAVEHVPLMRESGLLESLKHLKREGFWMYGLSHRGTKSIYDLEIPPKVIWVLGSESSGIRLPIERECDELIQIPQVDPEASFNVSVAAGIALSETHRQRTIGLPE